MQRNCKCVWTLESRSQVDRSILYTQYYKLSRSDTEQTKYNVKTADVICRLTEDIAYSRHGFLLNDLCATGNGLMRTAIVLLESSLDILEASPCEMVCSLFIAVLTLIQTISAIITLSCFNNSLCLNSSYALVFQCIS